MLFKSMIGPLALAAAMAVSAGPAAAQQPFDQSKYPAFAGQWQRVGPLGVFDSTKPPARGQQAPLTPEYQKIFEANLADVAKGGFGDDPVYTCIPEGMPRAMNLVLPMEIVITPGTTYILMEYLSMLRRVYTDGRGFPTDEDPSWMGYSIGKWIDEGNTGRYNVLEVETRNLKNPRTFDPSGLPVHKDGETVVKERFYLDKTNPDTLYDQITVEDHALAHPWTVLKTMKREKKPIWVESICAEGNVHVNIGGQHYMLNNAGELMPAMKDEPPPDLKHFQTKK
ncbi:MAG TPA: hypothetical protein VIY51_04875 [Xanthobacteraceae bacterium]